MKVDDATEFAQHFKGHAGALGFFFSHWGALENTLLVVFAKLLGTDLSTAKMIFSEFSAFAPKLNLMKRLLHEKFADDQVRKDLLGLISNIQKLSDTRNTYAHAAWGYNQHENGGIDIYLVPGTAPNSKDKAFLIPRMIAAAEIQADSEKALALGRRLIEFCRDDLSKLRSMPRSEIRLDVGSQTVRSDR